MHRTFRWIVRLLASAPLALFVAADAQAQDSQWVRETADHLRKLVIHQTHVPVLNETAIDTELQGTLELIVASPIDVDGVQVMPTRSKIICSYQPVRNTRRIPVYCDRVITPEGYDYRIAATLYGVDGGAGIPADRHKANGALQADPAKNLWMVVTSIHAVGVVAARPIPVTG